MRKEMQDKYCADCSFVGECNVSLRKKDGCSDRIDVNDPDLDKLNRLDAGFVERMYGYNERYMAENKR